MNDCYFEKKDWRACKEEVCQQRQSSSLSRRAEKGRKSSEPKPGVRRLIAKFYRWKYFDDAGKIKAMTIGQRRRMSEKVPSRGIVVLKVKPEFSYLVGTE